MSRLASRFAPGILILILWLSLPPRAQAQQVPSTNRVVSVVEDSADKFLLLNTAALQPLPPPSIRYLPGSDEDTVMVADFAGVSLDHPVQVLAPNVPGVRMIRVGQSQSNPPVCRISIDTDQPQLMQQLAFVARPGTLMLRWPCAPGSPPAQAPQRPQKSPAVPPPAAQLRPELPEPSAPPPAQVELRAQQGRLKPAPDRVPRPAVPSTAPDRVPRLAVPPTAPAYRPASAPVIASLTSQPPLPPSISLIEKRLELAAHRPFVYQSFRLHNPERYVIDMPDLPEIASTILPRVEANPFLSGLRAGHPDNDVSRGRLVLDLQDAAVSVKEVVDQSGHLLSLLLERLNLPGSTPEAPLEAPRDVPKPAPLPLPIPLNVPLKLPPNTSIVLDAGHGGSDPGAQRGDVQEKEITLGIVEKLSKKLSAAGARISLTRSDDTFVSLQDRVDQTARINPTLFLSVHINSLETNSIISGIETYFQTEQSKLFADCIHRCLVSQLEAPDRNVRKARFYVIKFSSMPSVLAEVGFISNKDERDKLISSDYQSKVADALARGVMLYLSGRAEPLPVAQSHEHGTMIEPTQSQRSTTAPVATVKPMPTDDPAQDNFQITRK